MAIKKIDSQGTKLYVLPIATDVTDCAKIKTAIEGATAKLIGCPQSIGDITETRNSTEIKCLSSNESSKALGAISRGSLEIGLLLDPTDAEGQNALKDAFANNEQVIIAMVLPDEPKGAGGTPTTKGNGTTYSFVAGVSGVSTGIAMDSAISYKVTLEIASAITECPAVAPKP